jgi:hypothetical protein
MPEIAGQVVKGPFAVGSKSEHEAIYLNSKRGRFVLRRPGQNAFQDPVLEKLVGKTVRCRGEIDGYLLLLSDWSEVKSEGT